MTRQTARNFRALIAFAALSVGAAPNADAEVVLAHYIAGSSPPANAYVGQSLITTATTADSFGDIRFTFYSDAGTTSSSAGNVFILTQQYLGTPTALSTSAAGFVAESTAIVDGAYVFPTATSLQGGTQYYVYADTPILVSGSATNGYADGLGYAAFGPNGNFTAFPDSDINFLLSSGPASSPPASSTGIASYTGGTLVTGTPAYAGQSATTSAGGSISNISFNFFSDSAASTPTAEGDLYVLSQPYMGLPADLSSLTPGFVAESTGLANGVYQFSPTATLAGGTQYFFYTDTPLVVSGTTDNGYAGGEAYSAGAQGAYVPFPTTDLNFVLNGTQAQVGQSVPTPETLALLGIGLAGGLLARRRRLA